MRTLEGSNRVRVGLLGLVIMLMVVAVGQSFASVPMLFAQPMYYAHFADAAGAGPGDKVRVSGADVGQIRSLKIDGDRVKVGSTLGGQRIGSDSRLSIRTDTILGKRVMEIEPRGTKALPVNATLPLEQSTTPYQLYDAFSDLTTTTAGWEALREDRSLLPGAVDEMLRFASSTISWNLSCATIFRRSTAVTPTRLP